MTAMSARFRPPRISGDLIKNYFYLCAAKPVFENGHQIRTAFYDHGIMSALVLLKAADVQRHYLNELSKKEFALRPHARCQKMLNFEHQASSRGKGDQIYEQQ